MQRPKDQLQGEWRPEGEWDFGRKKNLVGIIQASWFETLGFCFQKRKDGDEPTDEDSKEAISKVADKAKKEEVQSKSAESEKKEEEVAKKAPQVKRRRTANPYGAWERIKEEVDP